MQLLQGPVFKSYTVKKSVSVIHPKSHSPHRDAEKERPKKEQFFVPLVSERQRQEGPAVTTISFGPLRASWSQSARTLSQFTPRVTVQLSNCSVQREEKLLERMKRLELHDLKKNYESRPKLSEMRDSQTLLRKNTLFLVNCLKTRYRERKNAHIGERPEAANHMKLGNFSEKTAANTQYQQRFEYMEEAKQRLLQAKTERHVEGSRLSRLSPLLPEPWETEHTMH